MGAKPDLPKNKLLMDLLGSKADDSVAFMGYIGPDANAGTHIVFYRNIFDLTKSFEIKKSDILYSAPAPESIIPFGGVVVWVKSNSAVKIKSTKDGVVEIQAGRVVLIIESLKSAGTICIPPRS